MYKTLETKITRFDMYRDDKNLKTIHEIFDEIPDIFDIHIWVNDDNVTAEVKSYLN